MENTQNAKCELWHCAMLFSHEFLGRLDPTKSTIHDSEVSHQEEFDMRSCCFNGRTVLFSWLFLHSWWVSMAVATFSQNVTVIQRVWRIYIHMYTYIFVYAIYKYTCICSHTVILTIFKNTHILSPPVHLSPAHALGHSDLFVQLRHFGTWSWAARITLRFLPTKRGRRFFTKKTDVFL